MKWLLLVLLAFASGCAESYPIRDYALRITFASGGLCSATAVGEHLILSAAHCFKGDRLTSINGQPAYALRLVNDDHDHVLVRVSKRFKRWTRMGAEPVAGQHVRMIGQPAGMAYVYRELYVTQVAEDEIYYDGGHTFGGDSGSGMMNADGEVVGVMTGMKWLRNGEGPFFVLIWTNRIRFTREQLKEMQQ